MPLVVEEISSSEELRALERDWNALAAAHGEGLPFRTWEWNDAWWRWFAERRFAVRDSLFVRTFRTPAGVLVGVAPLILVRRPGIGPALVRGLEFVGSDPYVTELRGLLVHPEHEEEVHRALHAHLERSAGRWDWIRWRGVREGSGGERVLQEDRGLHLPSETPAYRLPLAGTWEEFKASRPRNLKESLRKCYNSLKRDGLEFELRVAREPAEVAAALERFLALHQTRAEAEGMRAHGNVFRDPASRGFLFDVCGRLAARDAVRVFELRIRDQVVACRLGFALGDTLYLYFSGYDPAWARYSVMTTTVAEAIQYGFANQFAFVHLSTGTDESKLRWRPDRTSYREGAEYAAGFRGRGTRWLTDAVRADSPNPLARFARGVLGRRRQAP